MKPEEERIVRAACAWREHVGKNGLVRADLDAVSRELLDAVEAIEPKPSETFSLPSE